MLEEKFQELEGKVSALLDEIRRLRKENESLRKDLEANGHMSIDEGAVFELIRKVQPAFVPRVRIKVDHDLVHATKLGVQHTLYLACIEGRENAFRPFGELDFEFQSLLTACVAIGIP